MTPSFCGCIVPETNAGFYTEVGYEPEGLGQRPRTLLGTTATIPLANDGANASAAISPLDPRFP